jgi:hypothetical protein
MSSYEEKSRVPTFDEKQENYKKFEMQWNAFAQVEGFTYSLLPKGHPHMLVDNKTVTTDEAQGEGKKQARAKKENSKAAVYYILAFKSARLRGMTNKANTNEWPGGKAWNIRESLVKKYRTDNSS